MISMFMYYIEVNVETKVNVILKYKLSLPDMYKASTQLNILLLLCSARQTRGLLRENTLSLIFLQNPDKQPVIKECRVLKSSSQAHQSVRKPKCASSFLNPFELSIDISEESGAL
ncbi:uncharacterized protein LOC125670880 isoform X1 [Ostrea edulis]|uniref:uncharacterized protein LOC125670880 isoform X1 n=2 Tax=Ostrea edulis TaxID=37623 RepID=UPI0024AF8710|nr:uncharacterized protein LOC125670880 isoform X1 [Ostrea edulis]